MAYTFNGVAFGARTPDGYIAKFGRAANMNVEHIPYSDNDVIEYGGLSAPQVKTSIIVLAANKDAFEALLGVEAQLVYGDVTVTARLTELSDPKANWDETHYFYNATWIQTA